MTEEVTQTEVIVYPENVVHINESGKFQSDVPVENWPNPKEYYEDWVEGQPPEGMYEPTYVGGEKNHETGEWRNGTWVDMGSELTIIGNMTPEALQKMFTDAIQGFMDQKAREYGYDSISNAVTYADEPSVPKFQTEGRSFRAWRSVCWETGYNIVDQILKGDRTLPTVEEVLAEMPAIVI